MPYSVLVVEDEPNIIISLQFLMKQAGYVVRIAEDGKKAIDEISLYAPDVILLDLMLPEHDGFTVCEKVRANPDWASTKILVLSAKNRDFDRDKVLALGADDFINKPFSTKDLTDRVKKLLELERG